MAKLECSSVFLLILFFSHSGAGESLFPFLPPFPGNINGSSGGGACGGAVCGRGNCVESNSSVLGFACSCDRGWKQAFDFGPCIVPNCTLNMDCGYYPPPPPSQSRIKPNISFLDPCSWINCGGGICNATSVLTHTCECEGGYHNLFNSSIFPCYRQCSFGLGCDHLGFNLTNSSITPPPPSTSSSSNSRNNGLRMELGWLLITSSLGLLLLIITV